MSAKASMHAGALVAAVSTAIIASANAAQGQLIVTPNIEQLCRTAPALTHRKTVIYVDVASIKGAKPEWGLTILNRLELAPRESLTVISVNPSTFEVQEVFDVCFPALSNFEMEEARKSRGLWEKLTSLDPADQQRENLQTFDARLRNALDKIIAQGSKYQDSKRRNILGAIALDKNRYATRTAFYRIIIYTDGAIRDSAPDTKASGSTPGVQSLAEKYPASFSGAEVSVFGIDGSSQDQSLESKELTFSAYFLKSWAHLRSFSPSLPQQDNFLFPPATRIDGTFEGGGTQGSLKLALFAAKQGGVANGWLAFNVGREILYVPFQGEYKCDDDKCRLSATCSESIPPQSTTPYFRKGDRVTLAGNPGQRLEGSLEAEAREVFKSDKQNVKYVLKFSAH